MNTKKEAFTPGPWYDEENTQGKRIIWAFDHPGYPRIAVASAYTNGKMDANARLIAAAPCLLSACKQALDRLMSMGEPVGTQDTGRRLAAISTLSEAIRKVEDK